MISGLANSLLRKLWMMRSGCAGSPPPRPNISNMMIEAIIMVGRCTETSSDSTSNPLDPNTPRTKGMPSNTTFEKDDDTPPTMPVRASRPKIRVMTRWPAAHVVATAAK